MKWYFALNAASIKSDNLFEKCVEVAVLSALQHTSLEPWFIFDGADCPLTDKLQRLGVEIVFHQTSLASTISKVNADDLWKQIASGAFLRTDIPTIDLDSEFVIYTDCDVMFLRDPQVADIRPKYFAVAPEFTRGDNLNMNTGIMVMNLPGLRQVGAEFSAFVRHNMAEFPAFDQGAFREFFAGLYDPLPEKLNWKPYWGPSSEAEIIHFHGPKPPHVRALLTKQDVSYPQILKDLFSSSPGYYNELDSLWHAYSARARHL